MSNFKSQNINAIDEKYHDYLPRLDVLKTAPLPDGIPLTIHMTHMNHLDLAWYWCLDDTIEMALETLRYEHDLKRFDPDLRWKVSTGRLDAGTIWMLKKTNAQWRREEEMLRHQQALKELDVRHGADLPAPLGGTVDMKFLADSRLNLAQKKENLRYERAKQEENALHRRTLRSIEAICPPQLSASSDCGCNH